MMEVFKAGQPMVQDKIWPLSKTGSCQPLYGVVTHAKDASFVVTYTNVAIPAGKVLLIESLRFAPSTSASLYLTVGNTASAVGSYVLGSYGTSSSATRTLVTQSRHFWDGTYERGIEGDNLGTGTTTTTKALAAVSDSAASIIKIDRNYIVAIDESENLGCHQTSLSTSTSCNIYFKGILVPKGSVV